MKVYINIFLAVVICAFAVLFPSCKKRGNEDTSEVFWGEYVENDSVSLKSAITKKYDLDELQAFFDGKNANENACFNTTELGLLFSDVDQQYPIEVIRSRGYSVYQVTQGGYFYVFWAKPLVSEMNQEGAEPIVYFSAYLSSSVNSDEFSHIINYASTAEDVKAVDPYFELSFLSSSGIFSYSYLNEEEILRIEYFTKGEISELDDLVVKEMEIVPRTSAPSRYSAILPSDIP